MGDEQGIDLDYDLDQVRLIAIEVRSFLETRWPDVQKGNGIEVPEGVPASCDMCRMSTAFLKAVLEREMPDVEWQCVGGSPDKDDDINFDAKFPGGYLSASGEWRAHYWVTDGDWSIVADVTADQFGGEAVTVKMDQSGNLDAPPFEYRENYIPESVEDHMESVRWRVGIWMEQWLPDHPVGWSSEAPGHAPR